jgi:hypothetical protein
VKLEIVDAEVFCIFTENPFITVELLVITSKPK